MTKEVKRMRVFAGPNGSGKSTIIDKIRKTRVSGHLIDFGIYINADEIAKKLKKSDVNFSKYKVVLDKGEFSDIAIKSGLIDSQFNKKKFEGAFEIEDNKLSLANNDHIDKISQITAHVLREKLLLEDAKFSFETVFSHESKVDIIKRATEKGYKVYFYFVSTESAKINQDRVEYRAQNGGHYVPPEKIESRYYRSLDLLHEASQYVYQAFYFDNSENGAEDQNMFAHFKLTKEGIKDWDEIDDKSVPNWFKNYYSSKITK